MRRTLSKIARGIAAVLLLCILAALISAVICARVIKTTHYTVALRGMKSTARIVVVADIHGKHYGADNVELCEKVRMQTPDAIVLLGDLFPSHFRESDADYVVQLTQSMQDIARGRA